MRQSVGHGQARSPVRSGSSLVVSGARVVTRCEPRLGDLHGALVTTGPRIVACSGGIDSLLLATVAHRQDPTSTVVAHTVTPAVPGEGTSRVLSYAASEGWQLQVVRSREFEDERYLGNPTDRCYWCKSNLYDAVAELRHSGVAPRGATILSGANLDDLSEYRPGLTAPRNARFVTPMSRRASTRRPSGSSLVTWSSTMRSCPPRPAWRAGSTPAPG